MAKKQKSRRSKTKSKKRSASSSKNWVDRLEFESVDSSSNKQEEDEQTAGTQIRVVSFNVLAKAYLSHRSHRGLPKPYETVVFNQQRRLQVLSKVLRQLSEQTDILCLQEVDMEIVAETLQELGFEGVSTPTTPGGGSGGRVDASCIYWDAQEWSLIDQEEFVRFDDLATLGSNSTELETNILGLKQSLLRRNMGVMVRLEHKTTSQRVVVANAHLFWNPKFDYVKLCQAHYFVKLVYNFADNKDPVILCGDLNSKPYNSVHTYLTRGTVNAKAVAPWYHRSPEDNEELPEGLAPDTDVTEEITARLDGLNLSSDTETPQIKYMLDFTLNRFCRWLRILGIDASLETEEEEIERTKNANLQIFERCRAEGRTLVTTSSKLVQRRDCPAGAYLINARTLDNLEAAFVHILLTHGVVLKPERFLTRCVVCNGSIIKVVKEEERKRIFRAYSAPEMATKDLECFECDGCGQGYWWDERPKSSASRVKGQATHLFELCLRAGVEMEGPLHMFDMVDVDAERKRGTDIEMEKLEVLEWLKQEQLSCPISLQSAYALKDDNGDIVGESKPFSNVTSDFVGLLDYVLFEKDKFELTGQLYVPASFNDLNEKAQLRNGHLLPSDVWPSDHLAVGAELVLPAPPDESELFCGVLGAAPPPRMMTPVPVVAAPTIPHAPKCECGCVPSTPSLFEMAARRKKARQAKQRQGRSA